MEKSSDGDRLIIALEWETVSETLTVILNRLGHSIAYVENDPIQSMTTLGATEMGDGFYLSDLRRSIHFRTKSGFLSGSRPMCAGVFHNRRGMTLAKIWGENSPKYVYQARSSNAADEKIGRQVLGDLESQLKRMPKQLSERNRRSSIFPADDHNSGPLSPITDIREVMQGVSELHAAQIEKAGPVIAVLWVSCDFHKLTNPTALTPLGGNITGVRFGFWPDLFQFFSSVEKEGLQHMGPMMFRLWNVKVASAFNEHTEPLALMIPLLLESKMRALAQLSWREQQALLELMKPVVNDYPSLLQNNTDNVLGSGKSNAHVTITLHAKKTPFVITSYSESTLRQWRNELEATIALLLPKLVIQVAQMLPEKSQDFIWQH